MDNIYYNKYLKYKKKYLKLKNRNIINTQNIVNTPNIVNLNGGNNKTQNKIKLMDGLKESYEDLLQNSNLESIKKINRKLSKIKMRLDVQSRIKRRYQTRLITKNIDKNKIFALSTIKYEFNEIELNEKYLNKYNYVIKNTWLSKDLYDSGFYLYQYKLHQYLSNCGLNRTKQLYGTCWFNVVINAFIFGDHLRGRIIQLLNMYEDKYGKDKFIKFVEKKTKDENKLKVPKSQDTQVGNIEQNIFEHTIGIFYKVLCQEGLRNTKEKIYNNFNLTNLAISIKSMATNKPINPKNMSEMAYHSLEGIEILIQIFNNNINKEYHLMYYNDKEYLLANPNHINMLTILMNDDYKKSSVYFSLSYYSDITIKNLSIEINDNGINDYIIFNKQDNGVNLKNMTNVDFIMINHEGYNVDKIPREFTCIVKEKKYLFKLDAAILDLIFEGEKIGHVVTGLICDNKYYIYDSASNFYYDCDWTQISNNKNIEKVTQYYDIYSADFIFTKIDGDKIPNKFFELYDKSTIKKTKLKYYTVLYYNAGLDFSYDAIRCSRRKT
jgi:hypothetical protein